MESILAQGPAKLIKRFRRNFEWNSNSAGMVPGITRTECPPGTRRNGIPAESLFADEAQIECRCLPMLDLGVINKQHHSFSSTTTPTHLAHHRHPQPPPTTMQNNQTPPTTSIARPKTARTTLPRHITMPSCQTHACKMARPSATSPTATWRLNDE